MNEQLIALMNKANEKAGFTFSMDQAKPVHDLMDEFAKLLILEVTTYLLDESERLYALASEETESMRYAEDYEICAEKCTDLIAGIEERFGVE